MYHRMEAVTGHIRPLQAPTPSGSTGAVCRLFWHSQENEAATQALTIVSEAKEQPEKKSQEPADTILPGPTRACLATAGKAMTHQKNLFAAHSKWTMP